ncbi:MAG: branched-chain amino acid aminotransferase, partial [Fibrobacter sp.]|nr:branched-chain amino acid aminotransferase [Fibrobacter sp.]
MAQNIEWKDLGFKYMQTDSFVRVDYRNGKWGKIETCTDSSISIHVAATALHYGQAAFEGAKAFRRADGTVGIFRPLDNARRMIDTGKRLVMQAPPEELFLEAVKTAVKNNIDWVPPYGTGASLYIRPLLIGISPRVGLSPSDEFAFIVLCMPVGPYYKDGFHPVKAMVQEMYDRAAPRGVGCVKAAGNYAAGLLGDLEGKKLGYPICLYLDSAQHRYIDEFGTSNFFGITKDNVFVTPQSTSILPSITNRSIQEIARDFGLKVENRLIAIEELENFAEVGACGTAAVITPVCSIKYREKVYTFGSENE